jgi:hypothetical protein
VSVRACACLEGYYIPGMDEPILGGPEAEGDHAGSNADCDDEAEAPQMQRSHRQLREDNMLQVAKKMYYLGFIAM